MEELELWGLGGSSLLVVAANCRAPLVTVMPPSGSIVVARLDGNGLIEADDVFGQFSAALNFPAYFGWNWDALSDCLRDLSWCPADRYMIIIDHADNLLSGSAELREALLSILSRAASEWANPLGKPGGAGIPFKILLLCDEESAEALCVEVARHN